MPSLDDADRSPCWNESKIRSWSAGSIPMPVSVTVTATSSSLAPAPATSTLPPSGVNFTALLSRLSSTCLSRSSSAVTMPSPRVGIERQA